MQSARRPLALAVLSLLLAGASACTGANAPVPIQKPQRAVVSASPQATPTALAFNGADADPVLKLATPGQRAQHESNRLPSDRQQIVVVDSTGGEGVWLRDAPAGEPIKVWPEGAPMLVVGDDAFAEDRTWRHRRRLADVRGAERNADRRTDLGTRARRGVLAGYLNPGRIGALNPLACGASCLSTWSESGLCGTPVRAPTASTRRVLPHPERQRGGPRSLVAGDSGA